jgi:hypothetical protein
MHLSTLLAALIVIVRATAGPAVCSSERISETAALQKKITEQGAERVSLQARLGSAPLQAIARKQRLAVLKSQLTQLRASISGAETRQRIATEASKGLEEERARLEDSRKDFDNLMAKIAAERAAATARRDSVKQQVREQEKSITAMTASLAAASGSGGDDESPEAVRDKLAEVKDKSARSRMAIAATEEEVRRIHHDDAPQSSGVPCSIRPARASSFALQLLRDKELLSQAKARNAKAAADLSTRPLQARWLGGGGGGGGGEKKPGPKT